MLFAVYLVNIGIFLGIFFNFLETRRCFIREGGGKYTSHMGIDYPYDIMDKIGCYAYWSFASWLLLFIIAVVISFIYLRSQDAPPTKITFVYIAISVLFVFLSSFIVAGEGHRNLMGGAL